MSMDIVQSGPVTGKPVEPAGTLPSRASIRKVSREFSEAPLESRATIVAIHPELGRFASADDRLNAIAANARTAEKRAAVVSEAISRMKEALEKITKNYPPFPPGSEERVRLLKSYAALRKQIAQMTVPPEEDAAVPKEEKRADDPGAFTFVLRTNGQVRTVPRADVRVGPSGLAIPEIQDSATEKEIQKAIGTLDTAARALEEQRTKAAAEATAGAAAELVARKGRILVSADVSGDLPLQEPAAQAISLKVRDDLGSVDLGLLHTPEMQYTMAGASPWR